MTASPAHCQVLPSESFPKVPLLQLPHTNVTWSEQLEDESSKKSSQASTARKAEQKARESVSMYLEDANKTMQIVEALRERQAAEGCPHVFTDLADLVHACCNPLVHQDYDTRWHLDIYSSMSPGMHVVVMQMCKCCAKQLLVMLD